jgi:hypothetical protein
MQPEIREPRTYAMKAILNQAGIEIREIDILDATSYSKHTIIEALDNTTGKWLIFEPDMQRKLAIKNGEVEINAMDLLKNSPPNLIIKNTETKVFKSYLSQIKTSGLDLHGSYEGKKNIILYSQND